jgi:hypothetical protein
MTIKKTSWARLQMFVIAAVFFGPLVVATWMYYSGAFLPQGRTNHGSLLEPIVNLAEELPQSNIDELGSLGSGQWLLIYANEQECGSECRDSLHTLRQSRKMLGHEMGRLLRVFLHGDSSPDTVFLANEHAGLIALSDRPLVELLNNKKPAALSAGGYFLIDPLGNLVMYFQPDIDPQNMVEDVKHLLELSRIG